MSARCGIVPTRKGTPPRAIIHICLNLYAYCYDIALTSSRGSHCCSCSADGGSIPRHGNIMHARNTPKRLPCSRRSGLLGQNLLVCHWQTFGMFLSARSKQLIRGCSIFMYCAMQRQSVRCRRSESDGKHLEDNVGMNLRE